MQTGEYVLLSSKQPLLLWLFPCTIKINSKTLETCSALDHTLCLSLTYIPCSGAGGKLPHLGHDGWLQDSILFMSYATENRKQKVIIKAIKIVCVNLPWNNNGAVQQPGVVSLLL